MVILAVLIIFTTLYFYYSTIKNHNYWKDRNVKYEKPIPLFGNHYSNVRGEKNMTKISEEYYWKYPEEKVIGYFRGITPELIITDLDIMRRILNVDFEYFYQRGLGRNPDAEMLMANLFNTDAESWRLLRHKLSPAFTPAKIKNMYPIVMECAEKLQGIADKLVNQGGHCLAHDLMAGFTIEFIGASGFGIQMDTINDVNSLYGEFGKSIFIRTQKECIMLALWELFSKFRKYMRVYKPQLDEFMLKLVKAICKQRNLEPRGSNDFVDLLLKLEKLGTIVGDSIGEKNPDGSVKQVQIEMDLKCMAAQLFIYFAAGLGTSTTAMTGTLYNLAFNLKEQENIQKEINTVLLNNENKLCYNAICEMSLLVRAFKETVRMFPPGGVLNRVCCKRYEIPELNITIDPGVNILIPVKAVQNDGRYFESPKKFKPERFERLNERQKRAYLPFGDGPRNCIGAKLGEMQSLVGLAAVLSKFTVEPTSSTPMELQFEPCVNDVQVIKGGVPLILKRNNFSKSSCEL